MRRETRLAGNLNLIPSPVPVSAYLSTYLTIFESFSIFKTYSYGKQLSHQLMPCGEVSLKMSTKTSSLILLKLFSVHGTFPHCVNIEQKCKITDATSWFPPKGFWDSRDWKLVVSHVSFVLSGSWQSGRFWQIWVIAQKSYLNFLDANWSLAELLSTNEVDVRLLHQQVQLLLWAECSHPLVSMGIGSRSQSPTDWKPQVRT